MSFIRDVIENPLIPEEERQKCLERVWTDPGVPDPNHTTTSYWIEHGGSTIADARSETLPDEADVVIIGSGITGTSVAYSLLDPTSTKTQNDDKVSTAIPPRVVMLEARGVCSGATGRNGGHCLETAEDYLHLKEMYGAVAAARITRFKLAHMRRIMEVAGRLGIVDKAQVRRVQFLSLYSGKKSWEDAKEVILAFQKEMPEEGKDFGFIEGLDLEKKHYLPNAVGAVYGPAGAMWPYRFVTSILADLRTRYPSNFSLETHTAVVNVTEDGGHYRVQTSRGYFKAKHVVHCTNGHICHLIPGLAGKLFPVRGQMSAQKPLTHLPDQSFTHSWLINYDHGYDYLTQLPASGHGSHGEMMLGGGFAKTYGNGLAEIGISRDDALDPDAKRQLERSLEDTFGLDPTSTVEMMWTGTMGFSIDGLPWVGRLPLSLTRRHSSPGQTSTEDRHEGREWMGAGFSGEGMVNAWLCGEALASMIQMDETNRSEEGLEELLSWFPEQMLITEERLRKTGLPRPESETLIQASFDRLEDELAIVSRPNLVVARI